jgi:hypothetical protein
VVNEVCKTVTFLEVTSGCHDTQHDGIQHNDTQHKGLDLCVSMSITYTQHYNALHNVECLYAECKVLFSVMLDVFMMSLVMLNAIMLSVMVPISGDISKISMCCLHRR